MIDKPTAKSPVATGGVTISMPTMPVSAGSNPTTIPGQVPPMSPQPNGYPVQETVVIPTGVQPENSTPLVPNQNFVNPTNSPSGKKSFPFIILIIVVVLALLGVGGWLVWGKMSQSGPVTLTYWGLWEDDTNIAPAISDFQTAYPNIKISYVKQSYKQYRERLDAAIQRGEGPDIFRFHNTWVAMLRNDLSPAPKTVMTPEEFSAAFYSVAKNDLVAGNSIYGVPLEIDGLGLYINEDLFAAAGVVPPVTWEDVLAIVPKLTVKSDSTITTSAIALGTTGNVEHWSDILAVMMMQNGARLANPTGKEAEEALLFFSKFSTPTDPVYTWNSTLDNSVYAFANNHLAMMLAPSWRAFDVKQMNPNCNFKIVAIPQLPGNAVSWASYWVEGVSSKSKNQEAAWKFIKFLTSKEEAVKIYSAAAKARLFGEPYARKDLATALAGDPYADAYVTQAVNAQSFPLASRTFDNGLNDQMIKYLEDGVNGLTTGGSPTSVLTTVANGFSQVLSKYGLVSASAPTNR